MGDENNVSDSNAGTNLATQIAFPTQQIDQERESRERLEKQNDNLLAHLEVTMSQIQTAMSSRFKLSVDPMQSLDDYVHVEDDDGSDDSEPADPAGLVRNQNSRYTDNDQTRFSFLIGNRVSLDLDPPQTLMHATRSFGAMQTTPMVGQTSTETNYPLSGVRTGPFEPPQLTPGVGVSHATAG